MAWQISLVVKFVAGASYSQYTRSAVNASLSRPYQYSSPLKLAFNLPSLFWSESLAISHDEEITARVGTPRTGLPLDDVSMMIQLSCGGEEPFGRLFPTFTVSLSSS